MKGKEKLMLVAALILLVAALALLLWVYTMENRQMEPSQIIEIVPMATATPSDVPMMEPAPTPTAPAQSPTPVPTASAAQQTAPIKATDDSRFCTLTIRNTDVKVAYGVDEATLKKSPGWLTTSASPGEDGMCVIYGHRNRSHLRVLEKVEHGDAITVTMAGGTVCTYTVTDIQIYENTADLRLPLTEGKTICLVTCYPFRYSGSAPGKCVVVGRIS